MKWPEIILVFAIVVLSFLVYNNIGTYQDNKRLKIENDSIRKLNKALEVKNDSIETIYSKLKIENESLKFKKTDLIYNKTVIKYGKEINRLDSIDINGYLDILAK